MQVSTAPFTANQRTYQPPARPVVVICLDGSADDYLDAAIARGRLPNLQRMSLTGHRGLARAAMPTFTNVNNLSIVTGVPPNVHGISGNYFYDVALDEEKMMNSAKYLRAETILAAAARSGRKVAAITAKDKLRELLGTGVAGPGTPGGIAFSAEKCASATREINGIENLETITGLRQPAIYSPDASTYVLRAGVALLRAGLADFLYLSTTDYMQHKYAPDAPEIVEFYKTIDSAVGELVALGAVVGFTADHGMNGKQGLDGKPNVIYLETELVEAFDLGFRVILPITDPYVVHHGALGSFAVIHLPEGQPVAPVRQWLMQRPGITEVYDQVEAARKLELPHDRLGELVVLSGRNVVIGRTPEWHDLRALEGPLRSHGGRYEEMVPLIFSHPLKPQYALAAAADPRNFDIFDFTLNGLTL